MSDLNNVVISGRVTRDTELRYTPSGTAVLDMGMCANRAWKNDGVLQEEPTFVDVTLWGKQAEALAPYLLKGTYVMVEARLKLETWETDKGDKRSKLKLVANQVNLGPRAKNANSDGNTAAPATSNAIPADEEVPF